MSMPTTRLTITVAEYRLLKPGLDLVANRLADAKAANFPFRIAWEASRIYREQACDAEMSARFIRVRRKLWELTRSRKIYVDACELAALALALRLCRSRKLVEMTYDVSTEIDRLHAKIEIYRKRPMRSAIAKLGKLEYASIAHRWLRNLAWLRCNCLCIPLRNNHPPWRPKRWRDHPVLREGLATMIESQTDLLLVAEAGTGKLAIALFKEHRPDITLLDLRLPDIGGIDVIRAIREMHSDAKIIVLTTYLGDVQAVRALKAGAMGYLLKATLRRDLLDTIRAVYAGKRRIPEEVALELAAHAADDSLTPREIDVLKQVADGCSNKVVADRLVISEDTVKGHVRNILSKLNANDRTHAVTIALRRGFLDL